MRRLDLTDNERAVLITTLRRLVDFHQVVSFKPTYPGFRIVERPGSSLRAS